MSTNENGNQRKNALVSTNENTISQKTFFVSTRLDKYNLLFIYLLFRAKPSLFNLLFRAFLNFVNLLFRA